MQNALDAMLNLPFVSVHKRAPTGTPGCSMSVGSPRALLLVGLESLHSTLQPDDVPQTSAMKTSSSQGKQKTHPNLILNPSKRLR